MMVWMAAALLMSAGPATGQEASRTWRTTSTEHFRVHYPKPAEAWARRVASEIEDIHARVVAEVGYATDEVIDVVIVDPYTQANGSAWPFLGSPRLLLWATGPEAASVIGHHRSWSELLVTHEDTHLAHMLRPSRNPLVRSLERLLGLGPISRGAPRWVTEGYATLVEARLTGYGRPYADFRALLLRRLAEGGRLPAYGELNAFDRWMGGSFAYLVGSAYLEWLEAQAGEGSLRDLWARMTARDVRSFEDAFSGRFGAPPDELYARFVAELTRDALLLEEARSVESDTLWMDLSWQNTGPAVSPDGSKIALVTSSPKGPTRLRVWSTAVDEEATRKRVEARDERSRKDPQDVADVDPKHPPHEELHTRTFRTRDPSEPRWLADGRSLLFTSWQSDGSGRYRPDLFVWDAEDGSERRVTRRGDVRTADPAPDGTWAAGVRTRWGASQLVEVRLDTGEVTPLTDESVDVLVDSPRISPDGKHLAYLFHDGAGWDIAVRDLGDGSEVRHRRGYGGPTIFQVAWAPDGTLLASVGEAGFVEVRSVAMTDGAMTLSTVLSRASGGAFQPEPTPDGKGLYFLSIDANGVDLHHTALGEDAWPSEAGEVAGRAPVVRPPTIPEPPRPVRADPGPVRPYGLGRTELRPVVGGAWSRTQGAIEAGVSVGDIVGRRDLLAMVAYGGKTGPTGGLLALELRRLPLDLTLEGFAASEEAEVLRRAGGTAELSADRRLGSAAAVAVSGGGWLDAPLETRIDAGETLPALSDGAIPAEIVLSPPGLRRVGWARLGLSWVEARSAAFGGEVRAWGQLGDTEGDPWRRVDLAASAWAGRSVSVRARYERGFSDTETGVDRYRLGGVPSAVLPAAWRLSRVGSPGFDLGALRGANRDAMVLDVGSEVGVFAERHRLSDDVLVDATSLVGIRGGTRIPEQPFGRLPAGDFQAGLGCLIEDPTEGFSKDACKELADWRLWMAATWTL